MRLTLSQAFKSTTNWSALLFVAAPEIWNMLVSDPSIHIPDNIKHWVTLGAAAAVIICRTWNRQGNNQNQAG